MSIASEITRLQTSKADSKAQINIDKDIINDGIDFINNEKVDSYDEKIAEMQEAYKAFIPVNTTSNTQIDAPKGGTIIGKTLKGNTTQDGTPTPDAPVEVKNVTGLQTVTISNGTDSKDYEVNLGKNLLQYNNFTNRTENGITITNNNDGTFLLNGTATADVSLAIDPDNFIPMTGKWKMTGCPSGGSSSTYMLSAYVGYWGGALPNIDTGSGTEITYTGNVKVRFYIKSGTTCNNLLFKPMVTYDLNATYEDFAPYFEPIELNKIGDYQDFIRKGTGKNLFIPTLKVDDTNINTIRCSVSLNGDEYTFSATGSDCYFGNIVGTGNAYNKLFGTLYDVSGITNLVFKPTNSAFDKNYVCYYDNNKVSLGYGQINNNTGLITPIANTKYIGFRIGISNSVSGTNYTTKIQLEKGSSATSFEPYGYKDKWYIEKNVLKLVVPNAVIGTMQNSNKRFYVNGMELGTSNILKNTQSSKTYGLYCDILGEVTAGQTWGGTQGISYDYNSGLDLGCMDFAINGLTTVTEYQNALKGKAIYVIANTPEYTLIENEDLIEQLEEFIPLLEGQNNISVDGSIPVYMDLDYIVKADKYLIGNRREGK